MAGTDSTGTQTLREHFQARRRIGEPYPWEKAVEAARSLAVALANRGDAPVPNVHPAAIAFEALDRWSMIADAPAPTETRDKDCLPPELQEAGAKPNEASAVYALAATLYEALTGHSVGPVMARPCECVPELPARYELAIARALVGDMTHRVPTLARLADELGATGTGVSVPPPSMEIEVDVRSSLVFLEAAAPSGPAAPGVPGAGPSRPPTGSGQAVSVRIPTGAWQAIEIEEDFGPASVHPVTEAERLAALKARLESDPRPRYVVTKRGIDHGPFSAVELLQQIAKHSFVAADVLRDELGGHKKPIGEWVEFRDFATHAALAVEERKEAAAVVEAEKRESAERKRSVGGGLVLVAGLAAAVGAVYIVRRGSDAGTNVQVASDEATSVDVEGAVKGKARKRSAGGGSGGGGGFAGGGLSYEAALNSNVESVDMENRNAGPDLTDSQLKRPLDNASFIDGCGLPASAHATVKVAIKNGHAIGVTVTTTPSSPGAASCIDAHVRRLEWPANPKLDSMTVNY
jgi:hypothetical protein